MEQKKPKSPAKLTVQDAVSEIDRLCEKGFGKVEIEIKDYGIKQITTTKTLRAVS